MRAELGGAAAFARSAVVLVAWLAVAHPRTAQYLLCPLRGAARLAQSSAVSCLRCS